MAIRKRSRSAEEKLIESVRSSLDDAEKLLRDAADATEDKAAELRERAMRSLDKTRETLHDAQDVFVEQSRRAVRATDDYVQHNPWQAMAAAGVIGLAIGALICRR